MATASLADRIAQVSARSSAAADPVMAAREAAALRAAAPGVARTALGTVARRAPALGLFAGAANVGLDFFNPNSDMNRYSAWVRSKMANDMAEHAAAAKADYAAGDLKGAAGNAFGVGADAALGLARNARMALGSALAPLGLGFIAPTMKAPSNGATPASTATATSEPSKAETAAGSGYTAQDFIRAAQSLSPRDLQTVMAITPKPVGAKDRMYSALLEAGTRRFNTDLERARNGGTQEDVLAANQRLIDTLSAVLGNNPLEARMGNLDDLRD